jgi:hypothetical protein
VVRRSHPKPSYVTVVASNPQTVDELCSYLRGAGVASNGTHTVHAVATVPPTVTAVVVFPDDFQHDEVEESIVSLRRARPKLLIVLVTGAPQHLRAAVEPDGRSVPPLVLPKPAFGWTVLDAIRGRTSPEAP